LINFIIIFIYIGGKKGRRTIRKSRLNRYKNNRKRLVITIELVIIWYLLIFTGSFLTTDTGAYFNDFEESNGLISTAENFCAEVKKGSEYWRNNCKDNSGLGNGTEAPDEGEEIKGQDPDNPGQNKGGCDDHTNAPCSEVTKINGKSTSNSVDLTWSNPTGDNKNFSYVKIYREGVSEPVGNKINNGKFVDNNLLPHTKYIYTISTVSNKGKESNGITFEITTSIEEVSTQPTSEKQSDDGGIK
jgi:hypothetical protein